MMRFAAAAASLAFATLVFTGPPVAHAQDDALEKLLKKLDDKAKPSAPKPVEEAKEKKPSESSEPKPSKSENKADEKPAQGKDLGEKDKGLDSLLEKLGGGPSERPTAKGSARPSRPKTDEEGDGKAGEEAPKAGGQRKQEAQPDELDEHLRRLMGRIPPKKDQDQQENEGQNQQGEEDKDNPLAEAMKKMRESESRLTKLDTGEETRKTQGEIVKNLETILEQIRQSQEQQQQQQGQQMKMAQQKPNPNQPNGQEPGSQAGPDQKATPPKLEPNQPIAQAKDTWGHLQGAMREVMGNVSRMLPLPAKQKLVNRYFESVARRSVAP